MSLELRLALIAALIGMASLAGIYWKSQTGRAKLVKSGELVDLAKLQATKGGKPVSKFGRKATLLQFSTEVCSQCKQTARFLSEVEKLHQDLLHIEVDVTNRLDLAAHFKVLQTPTTLVLDASGRVKARIGGAPKPATVKAELAKLEI